MPSSIADIVYDDADRRIVLQWLISIPLSW